ncbi:hypothetical protein [Telmatospirillum siberiense]|uniref:Asl1-like glycosyl hydrolase catalytic domain-containing protein n=1 Tax=Telmatospirillum siberiense TaxID=382514 RepID=A0A2N3PTV1_9PROT|nr:hypothetical protein [Telmatospirillum siberiense]PKU23835.1 hypothetical protein CWS72_14230 [Telmatospirillum siberiense]
MSFVARFVSAVLSVVMLGVGPALADNPFGVMLWPKGSDDLSLVAARAKGLGVGWLRPPAVFIDRWQSGSSCPICSEPARAGLDVALTVRNGGWDYTPRRPSTAPTDMEAYKQTLTSILNAWKPKILVVENEENNPQFYRAGATPSENLAAYGRELTTACSVAHAQGIACTNGGLSSEAASAVTWFTMLERGASETACGFAKRAFSGTNGGPTAETLCQYRTSADVPADVKTALLRDGEQMLAFYKAAPIDMVNLHWFGRDAAVLANIADVVAHASGKPVMSNELGQWRWDADPLNVRPLLRAAFAAGVRPAIWFSIDTPSTLSLFEEDGSLRQTGREFAHQMSGRK